MELLIDSRVQGYTPSDYLVNTIELAAVLSLEEEGLSGEYEISLSFVDEDEIQDLNHNYRNKNVVTDVLSFPLIEDLNAEDGLLGDIVICYNKAVSQAEEYGNTTDREIIYLVIHSMFHLLGYDHMDEYDKKIMRNKEKSVLLKLGV